MVESVFFKPISIAFAIVSVTVSLLWSILSFLAILAYNDVIKHDEKNSLYGLKQFTNNLHLLYVSEKNFKEGTRAVPPSTFHILMWFYFLMSLFLFFSSAVHIAVLVQKSKPRKINVSTIVFLTLTYAVCLYDFITCILFGVDYNLLQNSEVDSNETEIKLAVTLTLMVLAAKGFVLWIVNLTFSIILTILFRQKVSDEPILRVRPGLLDPEIYARNNAAYDAYGDVDTASKSGRDTWLSKIATERSKLGGLFSRGGSDDGNDVTTLGAESKSATSTWSRIPRANSVVKRPRSLNMDLDAYFDGPQSPPGPGEQAGARTAPPSLHGDDARSVAPSYTSVAFPNPNRFTLQEPEPDYDEPNTFTSRKY